MVALFALFVTIGEGIRTWGEEPWRSAASFLNKETAGSKAVMVYSGLVENDDPRWHLSDEAKAYLLAPFYVYPVTSELLLATPLLSGNSKSLMDVLYLFLCMLDVR